MLLVIGAGNGVWAKKVTYHILTKPFTVRNHDNSGDYKINIRVEALRCTSEEPTVGLPDQFKSPLAKNFKYWKTATSTYDYLYDYANNGNLISAKYYIYQCGENTTVENWQYACLSEQITDPENTDASAFTDIYVTYDYINDGKSESFKNNILELNGETYYNISVNMSGTMKYMCLNRSRNNRVANAKASALTGEDLADNDFVVPENGNQELGWVWGSGDNKIWGPKGVHLGFKFLGEDPYNFTIMTSYNGKEVHVTDAVTGVDSKATIKPFEGATLFGKMNYNQMWFDASNDRHYKIQSNMSNSDVDLKTGNYKDPAKYETKKALYYNTAEASRYDSWVGFYRKENYAELNTYALLPNPNGDYLFVASKMNMGKSSSTKPDINQPNSSSQYFLYNDDGNQPHFAKKTLSNAYKTKFYEIRTYTLKLKTHGSNTVLTKEIKWSDAMTSERIVDHVPDALRRKYVKFTGAYAEKDVAGVKQADTSKPISTFTDALANGSVIWLDYETDTDAAPFEFLPEGGSYADAHWYTMRVNGKAEQKNIAYNSGNNFITGSTSIGDENDLHKGENSANAMVAFMGDPYELKIISRATSEAETTAAGGSATAAHNRYVGFATGDAVGTTLKTNKTTGDSITWEIMYESTDAGNFVLRRFKNVDDPKYIGWSTASNNVIYSTTATRIRVVDLDKVKYTYHIIRSNGTKAIKATVNEYVGKPLTSWTDIPTIIRSPFLYNASVTYYANETDATNNTNAITNAPYNFTENKDIYVRYSYDEGKSPSGSGSDYNVTLNAEYIFTSTTSEDANIYSKESITTGSGSDAEEPKYQWVLTYSDPYAMTIKNKGKNQFIKVSSPADDTALGWDTEENASLFIVKQSAGNPGFYEVMVATGDSYDAGDGVGITTTYFNVGRNISSTEENTVKLYQNTTYISGRPQLRFRLIGTTATDVTYHLIDKANHELLQVTTRHTNQDDAYLPPRFRSPLVSTYHYYPTESDAKNGTAAREITQVGTNGNIYVTYDVNDLVNLKRGQMYLLKYEGGEQFQQEDGSDGLLTDPEKFTGTDEEKAARYKAVYPYCNGDCNFFVYGQEQYDLQQQGAASTRTRWAWYVQSDIGGDRGDPYHVKIVSRQTETYPKNGTERNAYFATFKPADYEEVVTSLVWPTISGIQATEYMVLGNEGQYQLMTSYKVDVNGDGDNTDDEDERRVVNSFEQYWKTFDTIRKKIYGDSNAKANSSDPTTIPDTTTVQSGPNKGMPFREYLKDNLGWHSYDKWAYAKRWNGYNNGYGSDDGVTPATSKGWEEIEHWFQTVSMGEGYFDFVPTTIEPVLILLDQHGWEVMRKPLPTSPTDPQKDAKYEAIRPYNSPMVKEYAFWVTAKKRTGFHQYYLLSGRIGGDDFTSTDLTNLPPYGSKNVLDKKGNLNDQYVTYIVKDEYAQTYNPSKKTGKEFLIEQGSKYASTSDGTTITKNAVPAGGMQKHLTDDAIPDTEKWYVKPNWNIDIEMGYSDVASLDWTKAGQKNPNAYEHYLFKDSIAASYISTKALTDSLGYFSFSNGFDPYNIQIMPKSYETSPNRKFMKTNATGAVLDDGVMNGVYEDGEGNPVAPAISLGDSIPTVSKDNSVWFDGRKLSINNATWMAVQDAEGNMQLMPRFDPNLRMSEFGDLIAPTSADAAKTYTKLYRAEKYEYYIIDNSGNESLRYKSGGELKPQTPDHFKSPLATNFKYYAKATYDSETNTYSDIKDEIEGSLDGATLTETDGNKVVYVRYEYDDEADDLNMLKGNWLAMQLNGKNAIYESGIKEADGDKPATIDGDCKQWHWKFAHNSQPDPYAIYIYNRSQSPAGAKAMEDRFALLSHSAGDYALAKAGVGTYTYNFLNGNGGMSTSQAAIIDTEPGFTCSTGTFIGTNSQVKLTNDVKHNFTYKVYTNSGAFAISADQTQEEVYSNDWATRIPDAIKTPLLNQDQFRYYDKGDYERIVDETPDTIGKNLSNLYGLYDDEVVVRYTPYDSSVSQYMVPNVRNATTETTVAKGIGSNDAALDLSQTLLYNIIWYNDNMMMTTDKTDVKGEADKAITRDKNYVWQIGGNDPYAMTLYNSDAEKFITAASADNNAACSLTGSGTTFMLLPKSGYDYGVLAITGNEDSKLTITDNGDAGTNDAAKITTGDPAKFIFFALATHKVIYHLMIKNIGQKVIIPYKGTENDLVSNYCIQESGSTLRDLDSRDTSGGIDTHIHGDLYQLGETLKAIGQRANANTTTGLYARDSIYCYDAGHVSLGDELEVPSVFYRPNVDYDFYIEGVYNSTGTEEISAMNDIYKGVKTTNMGENEGLLLNTVFVNIVYRFKDLDTNTGTGFVTSIDDNMWYTFETNDDTPRLAEYTGSLQTKSGYATHYTNDYLWTPVGDPYGFKMYNRYACKNQNQNKTNLVMTTASIAANQPIVMDNVASNGNRDIYELTTTSTTTPGYFRVQTMMKNNNGVQYYINDDNGTLKLSTIPTEWTFGLSEDVMSPYYQSAGYVGGLNDAGKAAYDIAAAKTKPLERLMSIQDVVYNHDKAEGDADNYIVHYAPGYYRLHSQPGSTGISTPRYASGYTHKIELTPGTGTVGSPVAIPLHFYEQTSYSVNDPDFTDLTAGEFTVTPATRGEIPLQTVTSDPASIFRFSGEVNSATISTQGLNVYQNKMDASSSTAFSIIDIGGGIVALQSGNNFLNYNQAFQKYDLKFDNAASAIESARWCMQPVQKNDTAGNGEMGLSITTNNGKDGYYYATFYAPFDVLLTDASKDIAYVCPEWDNTLSDVKTSGSITPENIGKYNTAEYGCPESYRGSNRFIPAGTPVIIRTRNSSGTITAALPTTAPSTPVSCVFTGKYLEQMLTHGDDYVYTFGLPSTGTFTPDKNFATNGILTASSNIPGTGVGFYKNANPNKEESEFRVGWTLNNKYVYGNKLYYRAPGNQAVSPARGETRGIDFVPVLFDVEPGDEEQQESQMVVGDNRVYDMLGRCVATEEQVKDGSWRQSLSKGMYILNGKKFMKKN